MRVPMYVAMLASLVAAPSTFAQTSQVSMAAGEPAPTQTYFEFQVEKPVLAHQDNPRPQYPEVVRRRGRGGEVEVQFVVDATGRPDVKSIEILHSTDDALTAAVVDVVPQMRFYPAEAGGQKVRQLVQKAFRFAPSP
jgi:periplasmic protein TonB